MLFKVEGSTEPAVVVINKLPFTQQVKVSDRIKASKVKLPVFTPAKQSYHIVL